MSELYDPSIKDILPHERMYTLQIGNERFVLSGASLSSDAPSYFTNFFSNSAHADKVLSIDRSPDVFKLIYAHLQGYYLDIDSADLFTRVFMDSLYYNLPKLKESLLNSDYYFVNIGGESIKIPKQILKSPGNTPNFFSVGNEVLYKDITRMIVDRNWIRPPPQAAPSLNRCSTLLKELLSILQGVEIEIRSDIHRRSLIKEAKYYKLNALVQRLMKHQLTYNPFFQREEIVISLEYLEGRSLMVNEEMGGSFHYKRDYVDDTPRVLIIQSEAPDVSYKNGTLVAFSKAGKCLTTAFKRYVPHGYDVSIFTIESSGLNNTDLRVDGEKCTGMGIFEAEVLRCMFRVDLVIAPSGERVVKADLLKADLATTQKSLYAELSYI